MLSALICALAIAAAAWAVALAGPGLWTKFAFLASMTPVLVYSTILPAPNGPEIAAGMLLWASLLALCTQGDELRGTPSRYPLLLIIATLAAGALAVLRALGPMWLGLIVLSVVAVSGPRRVVATVGARPMQWTAAMAIVVAAVCWGTWWSFNAGLTETSPDVTAETQGEDFLLGSKPLAWTLQMVAAFPLRTDVAHPIVYFS